MDKPKSTILTSRRLATLLLTGLFTGVFVGASTKYPFLAEHIDTAILAASLVVSVGFSAFTITDMDWGQKIIELSHDTELEIDDALLEALLPKLANLDAFQTMLTTNTAKIIQEALEKRK